jgi:serine/threonine-protein kinase
MITAPVRSEPFAPGEVFAEKYVVERVIGVGGVAVVVAARHAELDELVAIKVLRPEVQQRKQLVQRFACEAKAAVLIKSDHAARIFDVGVAAGRGPYLVMEYLEGQDLRARLATTGALTVEHAVQYVMQACEALAVAHAKGIVHRDIKPANLFLARRADGTEIIKVLDFGISEAALTGTAFGSPHEALQTQALTGPPLYMSTERIRSTSTVDRHADIWSLGVVLYELLTGHLAFPGTAITQTCADVLERAPRPMSTFVADIPEELQGVIDRCLAKDPERRYQDVAELAIALLPFGPSVGRIFAGRSSAIIHTAGKGEGVVLSSAPPPSSTSSASVRTLSAYPQALQVPRVPAITSPSPSRPPPSRTSPSRSSPSRRPSPSSAVPKANVSVPAPGPGTVRIVTLGATAMGLLVALGSMVTYALVANPSATTAVPAATPASAPAGGTRPVTITTEPPAARVEWDGNLLGETPITTPLPYGTHRVKLSHVGYTPETLTVAVGPYDAPDRRAQLTLVKLDTTPPAPSPSPAPVSPRSMGGPVPRSGGSLGTRPAKSVPPSVTAALPPAETPEPAAVGTPTNTVRVRVEEKKANIVLVE